MKRACVYEARPGMRASLLVLTVTSSLLSRFACVGKCLRVYLDSVTPPALNIDLFSRLLGQGVRERHGLSVGSRWSVLLRSRSNSVYTD